MDSGQRLQTKKKELRKRGTRQIMRVGVFSIDREFSLRLAGQSRLKPEPTVIPELQSENLTIWMIRELTIGFTSELQE